MPSARIRVRTSSFVIAALVNAVERDRVARGDRVEPAATTRPAGHGAELAALTAQPLAALVVQLRRKRARADARAVRLSNADRRGRSPRARCPSPCTRRPRSCASSSRTDTCRTPTSSSVPCAPSMQDALPCCEPLVHVGDAVYDVRHDPLAPLRASRDDLAAPGTFGAGVPGSRERCGFWRARVGTSRRRRCRCARRDLRTPGRCRARSCRCALAPRAPRRPHPAQRDTEARRARDRRF